MSIADAMELVDRQVALLLKQQGQDFFMQIPMFVSALESEPRVRAVMQDLWFAAAHELKVTNAGRAAALRTLEAARDLLLNAFPGSNDHDTGAAMRGDPGWREYEMSIAHFNRLAACSHEEQWPNRRYVSEEPDALNTMRRILTHKLQTLDPESTDPAAGPLRRAVGNAERLLEHGARGYRLAAMCSPAVAAVRLLQMATELNPIPTVLTKSRNEIELAEFAWAELYGAGGVIRRYVFGGGPDGDGKASKIAVELRSDIDRFHDEVRRRLGLTRSLRGVVSRYASRAMWHNADALRELVKSSPGRAEATLTADFARYLHDQGLDPLTDALMGGLKPDIVARIPRWTFYAEAKQYRGANPRAYILRGAYQVWDTLGRLRGSAYDVREAFYVVFRLGGPRITMPEELHADGVAVYPVYIDIAEGPLSGSKQGLAPIALTEEELLPRPAPSVRGTPRRSSAPTKSSRKPGSA